MNTTRHEGRNIKRLREIKGIKQGALAADLNISQQRLSDIEQNEKVDDDIMEQIAKILEIPPDAIRNFDENKAIYNISCTFSGSSVNNNAYNIQNINPIEKWIEAMEENKKLYERLLASEQQKISLLEKLINK